MKFEKLFTPIQAGSTTLKNRFVFLPFENNTFTEEGFATKATLDFYSRIADGGAALIVTGATNINPDPKMRGDKYIGDISEDKFIPGHRKLAEAMNKRGAKALVQIVDKTSLTLAKEPAAFSVGEIHKVIDYFVQGARRVKDAGFQGVDFHFAHIYTVHQFLSRASNKRTDEWGRGVEGRAKMGVEILRRTRAEVGSDFILIPRFCGDEFRLWGNTLKDTAAMAQMFVESGADIMDVSAGGNPYTLRGSDRSKNQYVYADGTGCFLGRTHPGPEYPDGVNVHLAEGIRKAIKAAVPVIAAGKIRTPQLAEEILQENKADLIGIGRGLLVDPEFPKMAQEGAGDEIIQCICCNFCHHKLKGAEFVRCAVLADLEKRGSERAKRLNQAFHNQERVKLA